MMNRYWKSLIIGVLVCLFFSCEQFAIFDAIAVEVKPKPARIKGIIPKIVKNTSTNKLYVVNGELWEFDLTQLNNVWTKISAPAGVRDVAVGPSNQVYVISVGDSPSLPELNGVYVQGIFGANSILFVAVGNGNSYSVSKYDGNNLAPIAGVSGLLRGAAHYPNGTGHYYLATSEGLYHSGDGSSFTSIQSGKFLGIVALTDKVVAVTEKTVYTVTAAQATARITDDTLALTGALATSTNTLYLGRSRGYRTVNMTDATWDAKIPGTANYNSTIAQVRVMSMYALSNDFIFASVLSSDPKRSGLMSLRNGSWNMEE
jgi:hypothetical protein